MRGFTLIEVLVTIGFMSLLVSAGAGIAYSSLSHSTSRQDRDLILNGLMLVRSRSMNGICAYPCHVPVPQGLHVEPRALVMFQGDSYEERVRSQDEVFSHESSITANDVIFDRLTAHSKTDTLMEVSGQSRSYTISVDANGRIETSLLPL